MVKGEDYITIREIANDLSVHTNTVHKWIDKGRLKCECFSNGSVLIDKEYYKGVRDHLVIQRRQRVIDDSVVVNMACSKRMAEKLGAIAAAHKISRSEVVRRAVEEYLIKEAEING